MTRKYVGKRYVMVVEGDWDINRTYESFSIVGKDGNSYVSKKDVPIGIDITNEVYWYKTHDRDLQLENFIDETNSSLDNFNTTLDTFNSSLADIAVFVENFTGANDSEKLQNAINYAIANNRGKVKLAAKDYTLATKVTSNTSIILEGSINNSSEYCTRLLCADSGIEIIRGSGDDNTVGIYIKDLRIEKTGESKVVGTYGIKLTASNSNIGIENVEVRYFEKNLYLHGVIGGNFYNVVGKGGKYGLYSDTNNSSIIGNYDSTNCNFYGCKFSDNNEIGIYFAPLTQGFNFYGCDIERNTTYGIEFANTAPASSVINFFGCWFEANPTHWRFTQKPVPVQFIGCYVYGGTNLFDNGGSGTITASIKTCKLGSNVAVNMDIFNGCWEDNSTDGTLVFSATEPNGYYFQKLRGSSFSIGGKTLLNVESIGIGRYVIHGLGTPPSSGFVIGCEWIDGTNGKHYLHDGTDFRELVKTISATVTNDFASIPAGSMANTLITVNGVVAGDCVSIGVTGTLTTGIVFQAVATASNSVRIYAHNYTSGAIDPASYTFNIKVFK